MAEPEVGEFKMLHREVCVLHERSQFLRDVFPDQSTLEVLNLCAPAAFAEIQSTFIDSIILGIIRIADDKTTGSLTLENISRPHRGTDLGKRLETILQDLRRLIEPLKRHRHKRIAHHDAAVAEDFSILPSITVSQIEDALQLIRGFMNAVSHELGGATLGYETILSVGDGKSLVQIVKDGARYRSLHKLAWSGVEPEEIVKEVRRRPDAR